MSNLLSRSDRWELWMSATPGAEASTSAERRVTVPENPRQNDLAHEVERLRGVIQTAVAALSYAGAHEEATRIRTALEAG